MTAENRDFLAEFEQLRVETDGIRNVLVSKPVHFQNLLKEIMGELKEMRKEIKEGKEELKLELNRKIDEQNLKMEQKVEEKLSVLKNEILAKMEKDRRENEKKLEELRNQNLELKKEIVEQKMEENEKKLEELRKEILKLSEKKEKSEENPAVPENDAEATRKIPIKQAVLGEWKMVEFQNWEDAQSLDWSFEEFSENLKFELVGGKLKQSGGGNMNLTEGDYEYGVKKLFVEDDHLKTIWTGGDTEDVYIQNGRLRYVDKWGHYSCKRFYEKL